MTGHHGWGYGQKDGRRRPWLARIRGDSPPDPRARPGFPDPQIPHPSGQTGTPIPSSPPEPGPPAQPEPWLPCAWRKVRAAPQRTAASCAVPPPPRSPRPPHALGPGPAAVHTHSPLAGTGDGGDPAQRGEGGRSGAERGTWVRDAGCGVRRISRVRLRQGKGEASPGSFPEGCWALTCWQVQEGMDHWGAHVCVWVSPWSRVSEHVPA